jgi:hypothetical protein
VGLPDEETLDVVRERFARSPYPVTGTDRGISVADPDGIEVRFRAT